MKNPQVRSVTGVGDGLLAVAQTLVFVPVDFSEFKASFSSALG